MDYSVSHDNAFAPQFEYHDGRRDRPVVYNSQLNSSSFSHPQHLTDIYQSRHHDLSSATSRFASSFRDGSNPTLGFLQNQNHFMQNTIPDHAHPPVDVPLHAPVPLPGFTPLLTRQSPVQNINSSSCNSSPYTPPVLPPLPAPSPQKHHFSLSVADDLSQFPQHQEMLNFYAKAAEQTFPTPSELLSQLTGAHSLCTPTSTGAVRPVPAVEPEKKFESQRKARHRAVAQSVGFEPTDPDSISSHDKKRHYLECLESYVMYLHDQLSLVDEPLPLERVSTYRGLSSRSIRTLLVHMENTVRNLHLNTVDEEQMFLKLRDKLIAQGDATVQENSQHALYADNAADTHMPYSL